MHSVFATAIALAALIAPTEAQDGIDPVEFRYFGEQLFDNQRVQLSDNTIVGNQITRTVDSYGYFYRPTTIWDGCVNRLNNSTVVEKFDWWTYQREIEIKQNQIVSRMYDLYGVEACKERQLSLFQAELKRQRQDEQSDILSYVLSEEEYQLSLVLSAF